MRIYITGIGGCVGSTAAHYFQGLGHEVSGCDSDARWRFFGAAGSVAHEIEKLERAKIRVSRRDISDLTISDFQGIEAILHAAGQPSHDFSRWSPRTDFHANATATLTLLELVRQACPKAPLVFLSTNKVYGDSVNEWPFTIKGKRYVPDTYCRWLTKEGINEECPIRSAIRTPFGVSKMAGDFMVQEYAHDWGMQTAVFRCSCLTGPAGAPVEMHGFLGYLVKCAVAGEPYTIYGHEGRQVRDNLAAADVALAALAFFEDPRPGVYNMGGGRENSCSILEAFELIEEAGARAPEVKFGQPRFGDHKWWVTDTSWFQQHYDWEPQVGLREMIGEMVRSAKGR